MLVIHKLKRHALLTLTLSILCVVNYAAAQESQNDSNLSSKSIYSDARAKEWASDFLAGRKETLARSVATDLSRPDGHLLAASTWLRVQESLGHSREEAIASAPDTGRARVEAEAMIEMFEEQGRPDEMLSRFPVSKLPVLSPFAFYILIDAANQLGRMGDAFAYRLALVDSDPGGFAGAWALEDQLAADKREESIRAVRAKIDSEKLRGTPTANYIKRLIEDGGLLSLDKIYLVRNLWQQHPDWYALRYSANKEVDLGHLETGLKLRLQADELYPATNKSTRIALVMFQTGKVREARNFLHDRSVLMTPSAAQASRKEMINFITVLGEAGEYGEQRKVLDVALPKYPDEIDIHLAMANLETTSKRPAKAAEQWREVLRLAPKHVPAWEGLVRAHRSVDDQDGAAELLRKVKTTLGALTPTFAQESLQLLKSRGKYKEMASEGESALLYWPDNTDLLRLVASADIQLGQTKQAGEKFEHIIAVTGVDKDSASSLLNIADKETAAAGDALLAKLQSTYPHSSILADIEEVRLSNRFGSDRSAIQHSQDGAIMRSPSSYWPYFYRAWEAMSAKDADGMNAVLANGLSKMPLDLPGRRAELIAMRAQLLLRMQNEAYRSSTTDLEAAAEALNQAESLGIGAVYIAKWRADLLRKQGDDEGASKQLVLITHLAPDDKSTIDGLMRASDEVGRKYF